MKVYPYDTYEAYVELYPYDTYETYVSTVWMHAGTNVCVCTYDEARTMREILRRPSQQNCSLRRMLVRLRMSVAPLPKAMMIPRHTPGVRTPLSTRMVPMKKRLAVSKPWNLSTWAAVVKAKFLTSITAFA